MVEEYLGKLKIKPLLGTKFCGVVATKGLIDRQVGQSYIRSIPVIVMISPRSSDDDR